MTIVYSQYYEQIGPFSDTKFIINMLEKVSSHFLPNISRAISYFILYVS